MPLAWMRHSTFAPMPPASGMRLQEPKSGSPLNRPPAQSIRRIALSPRAAIGLIRVVPGTIGPISGVAPARMRIAADCSWAIVVSRLVQQSADDCACRKPADEGTDIVVIIPVVAAVTVAIVAIPIVAVPIISASIAITIVAVPTAEFAVRNGAAGSILAGFTALVWELSLLNVGRSRYLRNDRECIGGRNAAHCRRQ